MISITERYVGRFELFQVDDGKEDDWMDGLVEEYEAVDAAQRGLKFHVLEEGDDETRQADWAQNREDADLLTRRYCNSNSLMDDPLRNQEGKRKEPMPVNNVLSGAGVIMRFCVCGL